MKMNKLPKLHIDPHNISYKSIAIRKHINANEKIFCDLCGKEINVGEYMYVIITDTDYAYISCRKPQS